MYFSDLTPYSYAGGYARDGLLNVGWLDRRHRFATAEPSGDLLAALWSHCRWPVAVMRGSHSCEFCGPSEEAPLAVTFLGEDRRLGFAEIRVFSATEAFAAPDLIFHYVEAHHYAPPAAFVDALMNGAWPGSSQHLSRLKEFSATQDRYYFPERY